MSEGDKGRYIKQIRLAGHKSYFPNKYYSAYDFMDRVNEAVKGRYDLTVIEVRYIVSKTSPFRQEQGRQGHGRTPQSGQLLT
jgi:hypothetical protein